MRTIDWDIVDYKESVERQLDLVERVARGEEETIVLCRHPSVVTLGRASKPGDIAGWDGPVSETSRGGRATYHGPNQIVIYPIIDLKRPHALFRSRDLHGYMRSLEMVVCDSLKQIGIENAEARTTGSGELSLTGVWAGDKKVASIGIAVRKWVSYHGCAINVESDPRAFLGISPCGFQRSVMTNIEEILGKPKREELKSALVAAFSRLGPEGGMQ